MKPSSTKNFWIVDVAACEPILRTVDGVRVLEAGVRLAEQSIDCGERLQQLVDFVRYARSRVEESSAKLLDLLPLGVSHALVEQIAWLAYWKNYRLEFRMDRVEDGVVVWVCFPELPRLNCRLDDFPYELSPYSELQGWLDFFSHLITEHAQIWQIHLVLHKSLHAYLAIPDSRQVHIEFETREAARGAGGLPRFQSSTEKEQTHGRNDT